MQSCNSFEQAIRLLLLVFDLLSHFLEARTLSTMGGYSVPRFCPEEGRVKWPKANWLRTRRAGKGNSIKREAKSISRVRTGRPGRAQKAKESPRSPVLGMAGSI